jgi:DNA-binding GntR family transcriptional regulator
LHELNQSSGTPLYKQLEELLRASIASASTQANVRLPSEKELSDRYRVSRITVRKAVEELEKEGYLVKVQGRGTFTRKPKLGRDLHELLSFTRTCQIMGMKPGTHVLKCAVTSPTDPLRETLQLKRGEKVVFLYRIRFADDVPIILERNYFPSRYSFLVHEDLEDRSLYDLLRTKYRIFPASGHKTIEIVPAGEEEVKHLLVAPASPMLLVTDTTFDSIGMPIHQAFEHIVGDRFKFLITVPASPT